MVITRSMKFQASIDMSTTKKRVLVAMSGGVDSSVAAALLLEQGYEVIGVTMQLWDYTQNEESCNPQSKFDTCCSLDDVADARSVAYKLNIPFYVMDYQEDFKDNVVDYFTSEYLKGRTPNPCVACNTFLKFDHLMARAQKLKCDYVATGHYARVEYDESKGIYKLLAGKDVLKDQSYFLYSMTQERLAKILFPLGSLTKADVRSLALKYGLVNAEKKESMEICFIPNNDYAKFVEKRANESQIIKGDIFHEEGTHLGAHDGIHKFTIGQRKGLGVSSATPLYVTRLDPALGRVYVGEEKYLLKQGFSFSNLHKIYDFNPEENDDLTIKIRYRTQPTSMVLKDEEVRFLAAQRAVTPGQVAVIYKGEEVLGGGFIESVMEC
jgi:tRNA-specific 2-thiouridylase